MVDLDNGLSGLHVAFLVEVNLSNLSQSGLELEHLVMLLTSTLAINC